VKGAETPGGCGRRPTVGKIATAGARSQPHVLSGDRRDKMWRWVVLRICEARLVEDPGLDVHTDIEQDVIAFVDEVELLANGVGDLIEENGHVGIAVRTPRAPLNRTGTGTSGALRTGPPVTS
jgi:hypothetical protein